MKTSMPNYMYEKFIQAAASPHINSSPINGTYAGGFVPNYEHVSIVDSLARITMAVMAGLEVFFNIATNRNREITDADQEAEEIHLEKSKKKREAAARDNIMRLIRVLENTENEMTGNMSGKSPNLFRSHGLWLATHLPSNTSSVGSMLVMPRHLHSQHFVILLCLKAKCFFAIGKAMS